jgi:hypothetical protein
MLMSGRTSYERFGSMEDVSQNAWRGLCGPTAWQTFYEALASIMWMKPSRRAVLASTAGAALALAQRTENSLPIKPNSRDAVTVWIRDTAIRLSTPVAGHGFNDMAPLKKIVGDARIVALGEATHGTREFFQLKHCMLRPLLVEVDEMCDRLDVTRTAFVIKAVKAALAARV